MNNNELLLQRVIAAKEDLDLADELIRDYLPFIHSECAKFAGKSLSLGKDDELSVGMLAFHEAIRSYSRLKGAFLKYCSLLIKNRLIDFARHEKRHQGHLSLDAPIDEDGHVLADVIADKDDKQKAMIEHEATIDEIEELKNVMHQYGISLKDISENCPVHEKTKEKCLKAIAIAKDHHEVLAELESTKRLPLNSLTALSGVNRKTLERHRRYLLALLLIYTNGFEIIRGHLWKMTRGIKL